MNTDLCATEKAVNCQKIIFYFTYIICIKEAHKGFSLSIARVQNEIFKNDGTNRQLSDIYTTLFSANTLRVLMKS